MNHGLKNYTKQLTKNVGRATINVNLFKEDANMHVEIPLFQIGGVSPFNTSLIFNYQEQATTNFFGNGFKSNFYNVLSENGTQVSINNADGSTDHYTIGEWNRETQLKAVRVTDENDTSLSHIELVDKNGNKTIYGNSQSYPTRMVKKTGEVINITTTENSLVFENEKGDKVEFVKENNQKIGGTYSYNNTVLEKISLGYQGNNLVSVEYKTQDDIIIDKLGMEYIGSSIIVKDDLTTHRCKYEFTDNRVTCISDGYTEEYDGIQVTGIVYAENSTRVNYWDGNYVDFYFDNEGLPLYQIDKNGYAIETEYDRDTKRLIAQSNPFLIKGPHTNYFEGLSADNFTLSNVNREAVILAEGKWKDLLGERVYRFTHSGSGNGSITFSVPIDCVGTDTVTAIMWAKQNYNYSNGNSVTISMQIGDGDEEILKKPITDSNFEMILLGATCSSNESSANFTIVLTGDVSFELGGIQVLRQDFGTFFEYDEDDNLNLIGKCAENAKIVYDFDEVSGKNNVVETIGFDASICNYEYNSLGYPTKSTTSYGVNIENYFHEDYPSLLERQVLVDKDNNKLIETRKTFSEDGRHVIAEYDELDNCQMECGYNNDKIDWISNAMGTTTSFDYQNGLVKEMLLEKNSAELSKAVYTYYPDNRRLHTVTLKNGSIYEFSYNLRGCVNEVKLNGVVIFTYDYNDQSNNVEVITYGGGEKYRFTYNADNQIEHVYYVYPDSSEIMVYHYYYDAYKRLKRITDRGETTLINYNYDDAGRIKKEYNVNANIEYTFDNLGKINSVLRDTSAKTIHESYAHVLRSQSEHPKKMEGRFSGNYHFGLFDGTTDLVHDVNQFRYITSSNGSGVTFGKDGALPYVNIDSTKALTYQLADSPEGDLECGCVKFWFKPSDVDNTQYMFGIQGTRGDYLEVYMDQGQMRVEAKDWYGKFHNVITGSGAVTKDKWNFFALNFYFREDEGSLPNCEISLTVNNDTRFYSEADSLIKTDFVPIYYIGRSHDGSTYYPFEGKIACLAISPRTNDTYQNTKYFYNVTKDYVEDCQYTDVDAKTFDVTESIVFMPDTTSNSLFDIYPLNSNLMSTKGKRPSRFVRRIGVLEDKDKSFNFNTITKRYAYVADGSELAYLFGQSGSGTIIMRTFIESSNNIQYLFEGKDANGSLFSLYRNKDNYLCVNCAGNIYQTNLKMVNGVWHTVGMSFTKRITGDSVNEVISGTVRVYLDGNVVEYDVAVNFTNLEFMIGRRFDKELVYHHTGSSYECYPLYGQIEMLCASNAFHTQTTLNRLANAIKTIVKANEYDDFGRLIQTNVMVNDTRLMNKKLTYENRGSTKYTSQRVARESFEVYSNGSSNGFDRAYRYDILGNVKEITDGTIGSHTYTYDFRGFLTKDDNTTFTYDDNGNITQKGDVVFGYDNTMKDKLVSVGGKTISYSAENVLAPIAYDGKCFGYEGRRLISFTNSNQEDYVYEYNEKGQRIRKETPECVVNYVYSGNKLIAEECPYYDLNFLYDENDQLYGFIKDSSLKYFYLRDSLQNILGIIDSTGNLVVKYDYTAYGECTITLDTNGIGALNPFRYKGYYYDNESGMYYCNSRYYVPEWCRWLTPRSVFNSSVAAKPWLNLFMVDSFPNNRRLVEQNNVTNRKTTSLTKAVESELAVHMTGVGSLFVPPSHSSHVLQTYVSTRLFDNAYIGGLLGNITLTETLSSATPTGIYSFSSVGNGYTSMGIGFSQNNKGGTIYWSDNMGIGVTTQLTKHIYAGGEVSVEEGIKLSVGLSQDNISKDISVNIGWGGIGLLGAAAALAFVPIPGSRVAAGALAIISFFI